MFGLNHWYHNLNIVYKFFLIFSIVTVIVAAQGYIGLTDVRSIAKISRNTYQNNLLHLQKINTLTTVMSLHRELVFMHISAEDENKMQEIDRLIHDNQENISDFLIKNLDFLKIGSSDEMNDLLKLWETQQESDKVVLEYSRVFAKEEAVLHAVGANKKNFDGIKKSIAAISHGLEERAQLDQQGSTQIQDRSFQTILFLIFIGVLIFVLLFLLSPPRSSLMAQKGVEESIAEATAKKVILIISDDDINMRSLQNILQTQSYKLVIIRDSLKALFMVKAKEPDLVLLNLIKPKMDNNEMCLKIRQWSSDLPIIVLTQKHQLDECVQAMHNGANDYLPKPFHKEELLHRLEVHLKIRETGVLKEEIRQHRQVEAQLNASKQQLVELLDVSEDSIIATDSQFIIHYLNLRAKELFQNGISELEGAPLNELIPQEMINSCCHTLTTTQGGKKQAYIQLTINTPSRHEMPIDLALIRLPHDTGLQFVCLLRERTIAAEETHQDITAPVAVSSASLPGQNIKPQKLRGYYDMFKTAANMFDQMHHMFSEGSQDVQQELLLLDQTHSHQEELSEPGDKETLLRKTIVEVMTLSFHYWRDTTGKDKFDLAEESGIWSIGWDKGSRHTRTLNNYFSFHKLPQKRPRWKDVLHTAYFVLQQSPSTPSPLQSELQSKVRVLETLIA